MRNTNYLASFRCPKCGHEDDFRIEATSVLTFSDDGSDDMGAPQEWNDDSYCECCACPFYGTVKDFDFANAANVVITKVGGGAA